MPASASIDFATCILVIGATSGIGRSLAIAMKSLPSNPTVIAAGRRQERLDQLSEDYEIETIQVDVDTDAVALESFVKETLRKYPNLDAVVFSSGVQHQFDFAHPEENNISHLFSEININYISIVTMVHFFLPHLLQLRSQNREAWLMPVSSGLAFAHYPAVLNYAAMKSALHGFTASLRIQLRDTNVNVIEIVPPLVESELHDAQGTSAALANVWMPLDEYTAKTMEGLRRGDTQVLVGGAVNLYERYEKAKMNALNERML